MASIDNALVIATFAKWIVLIALPLVIANVLYKLYFHPLRAYPGPLLGKLTGAYGAFWASKKNLHLVTYENILKYGPVIRQAPNRLIFNTPESVQDIYSNPVANKGYAYEAARYSKYPAIIVCLNRAKHRQKRRLIAPAFTDR